MSLIGAKTATYFKLNRTKSTGAIRSGSSTKAFGPDSIKSDWYNFTKYLNSAGVNTTQVTPEKAYYEAVESLQEKARERIRTDVEFEEYPNVQAFVEGNLEKAGIVIDELGRIDTEKSTNTVDYLYLLADQYNKLAKSEGWLPINTTLIERVMNLIRFNTPKQYAESIRRNVAYREDAKSDGFDRLVKLLRPNSKGQDLEIHASALKHYVWQIKRKLAGAPVLDPLMIYIHGNQGIGKSSLVRHINREVLGEFYSEQDVADALDARSSESKQNYYSILADEISYCDDATVAKIKKLLTSTAENARVLGTNSVMKVVNNTTWAATSNHSLMTTIYDETGLRRFWEIPSTIPAGQVLDFAELMKIDVVELWRSVDENLDTGYYSRSLDTWDAMQEHQNKSVAKSNAHAFLYMAGFLQSEDSGYCWCSGKDLFRLYTEWSIENNVRSKGSSRIWFDRKLKQMDVQSVVFERETYFWLNGAGDGQVAISKDMKAPTTKAVTVPKSSDPELQKLVDNGFSKRTDVEKLVEIKK